MDEDVCSISGMFGACIIEEAEKRSHNYSLIRRASSRFFRSIKQAHRSVSGSLSSLISRQNDDTEHACKSEKSNSSKTKRPLSFAFGEEVQVLSNSTSAGEISFMLN